MKLVVAEDEAVAAVAVVVVVVVDSVRVPPTICLTAPSWMSMQGRNMECGRGWYERSRVVLKLGI